MALGPLSAGSLLSGGLRASLLSRSNEKLNPCPAKSNNANASVSKVAADFEQGLGRFSADSRDKKSVSNAIHRVSDLRTESAARVR